MNIESIEENNTNPEVLQNTQKTEPTTPAPNVQTQTETDEDEQTFINEIKKLNDKLLKQNEEYNKHWKKPIQNEDFKRAWQVWNKPNGGIIYEGNNNKYELNNGIIPEKYAKMLQKAYDQGQNLVKNNINGWKMPWVEAQESYKLDKDQFLKDYDNTKQQLSELQQKYTQYKLNKQSNLNAYKNEFEAMKRGGILNPYYMATKGIQTANGSANLSTNLKSANNFGGYLSNLQGNKKREDKGSQKDWFKEITKYIMLLPTLMKMFK